MCRIYKPRTGYNSPNTVDIINKMQISAQRKTADLAHLGRMPHYGLYPFRSTPGMECPYWVLKHKAHRYQCRPLPCIPHITGWAQRHHRDQSQPKGSTCLVQYACTNWQKQTDGQIWLTIFLVDNSRLNLKTSKP